MRTLSCHILDTSKGTPAAGIAISLYHATTPNPLDQQFTDSDGRVRFEEVELSQGQYTLVFDTNIYCKQQFGEVFFPEVRVTFCVTDDRHYHIPLLLSPYSYSTYRGS
ncbi:hydroxyisourate hydrolase [Photobacterium rosenbergii]|uniref:hydroxyisourate hydrolase n=1 Tax=Photobacterium rosenbergii TaxID=294936 RepID=UPI001C9A1568|nr:hydroxyisourate hydrolase [Photobacterium rosenbergii]MBY5947841.1 hydroxyisourate hydrolase [Photobacterium rosenbergii]